MMASILLYGFASALVGGISSPGGAVAGGFIVGVLENLIAYFGNLLEKASGLYLIGNGEKLSVALVIVIIVLTLKPERAVRPSQRQAGLSHGNHDNPGSETTVVEQAGIASQNWWIWIGLAGWRCCRSAARPG